MESWVYSYVAVYIQHPITEGRQIALEAKISVMETLCLPLSIDKITLEDVFQLQKLFASPGTKVIYGYFLT